MTGCGRSVSASGEVGAVMIAVMIAVVSAVVVAVATYAFGCDWKS